MVTLRTDFPGGNGTLLRSESDAEGETVWVIADSKAGEPQPLWFHVRIEGARGPRVRCVLANAQQCLGNVFRWKDNFLVVREGEGPWRRAGQARVETNEHLVPEMVCDIETTGGPLEVAFCFPYQQEQLNEAIAISERWKSGTIGYSRQGREITRIYNDLGDGHRSKPGVYLVARQHSGETPGSWVLDGIIRHLASLPAAQADKMCWWAVPFADPDGAAEGYYGKDQYPHDLNRSWNQPPARAEVFAIQKDLQRFGNRCTPAALIDLHAPAHHERGCYFYASRTPERLSEVTLRLAHRFIERLPERLRGEETFRYSGVMQTSAQAGESFTKYVMNRLGYPALTLECSYQGPSGSSPYTIEDYRFIGKTLADTIYELIT